MKRFFYEACLCLIAAPLVLMPHGTWGNVLGLLVSLALLANAVLTWRKDRSD